MLSDEFLRRYRQDGERLRQLMQEQIKIDTSLLPKSTVSFGEPYALKLMKSELNAGLENIHRSMTPAFKLEGVMPALSKLEASAASRRLSDAVTSKLSEQQRRLYEQIQEHFEASFSGVREAIDQLAGIKFPKIEQGLLPSNLEDVDGDIAMSQILDFARDEAIAVYLVPRGETLTHLVQAGDSEARRQVLIDHLDSIVDDCEAVLDKSGNAVIEEQVALARDGVNAIRNGNVFAAQALFTVVLDTMLPRVCEDKKLLSDIKRREKEAIAAETKLMLNMRNILLWLPISNAHQQYWPAQGDEVPSTFSRHASVHAATLRQYSKPNCVQALMLVASLVGYASTSC